MAKKNVDQSSFKGKLPSGTKKSPIKLERLEKAKKLKKRLNKP